MVRRFIPCLVVLALCSQPALSRMQTMPKSSYDTKMTFGLYKRELESPLYYSTFVPIFYEYNLPTWNNMDITLRDWRGKCETDDFSPSYSCPVFFHFEKFIERFQKEVLPLSFGTNQLILSSPISLPEELCNSIEQHFPGALSNTSALESYLESLKKCPIGSYGVFKRSINDYIYNIKEIYKTMNQKFESEFSNQFPITATNRVGPAYYINALASHQNSMMFNYWVEKTRWNQAQMSCNGKMLPTSVVRIANFTQDVAKIIHQESLGRTFVPSVPTNQTSVYYKIPITDCTFLENGNFAVRILIPVLKRLLKPKMYSVKTVPFIYNDGSDQKLCHITTDTGRFLHDEYTGLLQKTDCKSSALCQVKESSESPAPDMCVSSFFSNSLQNVKKYCKYDCLIVTNADDAPHIPIFTHVSSDTYIITGNSVVGVLIKCDGRKDTLLSHHDMGALEIRLPCSCYLMFHSESYHVEKPCGTQLGVSQVVPVVFVQDNQLNNMTLTRKLNALDLKDLLETNLSPVSERLHSISTQEGLRAAPSTGTPIFLWILVIVQSIVLSVLLVVGIYKLKVTRTAIFYSKERLVYNIKSVSTSSLAENQRASSVETVETTY